VDLAGAARPQGLAHDAGAYEYESIPDTIAPIISAVAATANTATSATVTWVTDEPADAQVEYGATTDYGSTTPVQTTLRAAHSLSLSGLSPLTTYHYRVLSKDKSGNVAVSEDFTFTTPDVDRTPPVISAVTANAVTPGGATITWMTDELADAQVEFGATTDYGSTTAVNATLLSAHSMALTGLTPATEYHYRVRSKDAEGNLSVSEDFTFTTLPPADTTPPIAIASPLGTVSTGGDNRYTFTVTYTDEKALNPASFDSSDIRVTGPNAFSQLATLLSVSGEDPTTRTVTYQFTPPGGTWNSADNGTYTVALRASQVTDASGNAAAATTLGTVTVAIPDTAVDVTAPTVLNAALRYDQTPHVIFFQFSEGVTGVNPTAVLVYNTTTQRSVDRALYDVTYDPATFTLAVAFTGLPGGMLPDGNYYIELDGDVIFDPAGNAVDGNGNGIPGGNYRLTPFVLQGDINHDRTVNSDDFAILYSNFGATGNLSNGDLNSDSKIDFVDFQILERCMGHSLAAPAPEAAAPAPTAAVIPIRAPARVAPVKRPERRLFSSSRI
jgi:hypothetical protein